jgi:ferredoxin/flavodoxin---NADP+ reductase
MNPEQIAELRRQKYNATVAWLHKGHSDLMRIRIRPDKPLQLHKPGQYTSLGLGYWEPRYPGCQDEVVKPGEEEKIIRRAYSIGCPILDDYVKLWDNTQADWLEFYIVLVRESDKSQAPALTPRLFMLREGDRLNMVEKITGHFTSEPVQPGNTVLFLSTGTGEAPHNYMTWELLRRGHTGRILSACCVRYRRDLAYLPVHEELMRQYPHYTFLSLTTREVYTIANKVYIQDLITSGQLESHLGRPLDAAHAHVYLCGNPNMIGVPVADRHTGQSSYPKPLGVVEILEQRGFKMDMPSIKFKGNIHFEEYW